MEECCLFLRGEVFIANSTAECAHGITGLSGCDESQKPYVKIGNTSILETSVSSSVLGRENIYNKALERSRVNVEGITLNLTIECASKMNLIQALYAKEIEYEINERQDKICYSKNISTYITSRVPIPETIQVTFRDALGNVEYYLLKGVDYILTDNKVTLINQDNMPDSLNISIEYEFENIDSYELNFSELQPKYKEVLFVGKNAASESNEVLEVKYFRVLFKPIETFDLISKGTFLNLPLSGVVEESNNGWFKIKRQFGENDELGSIIY